MAFPKDPQMSGQKITRRRTLATLGGATALVLAAPHVARAAIRTVRFAHNNSDESHYGQGAIAFARAVAASPELGGALKIEVYSNAALGDELSTLKNCAAGTLDMVLCSNSVVGNAIPEFGLVDTPFLFASVDQARRMLDGEAGKALAQLALAQNLALLAWGENGLRHITANKPIRTPADLKGLKIRVPQSDIMLGGFRALGADASSLSFNLLPAALRSGQFQAQENPIAIIEFNKLYEFQTHLSLTGHIYDPADFLASTDLMEDLTPPQRVALAAAAQKGAAVMREVSGAAQHDGVARLRALGMTIVEDVDKAAFAAAARPYLESLKGKYGAERINSLMGGGA